MKKSDLMNFFFEAALATYAGGAIKGTITELPGSKVYTYKKDELLYKDVYFVYDLKSGGQTTIFTNVHDIWIPVWLMQYNGFEKSDNKQVIQLLKAALTAAYTDKQFFGGRGPGRYCTVETGELRYINRSLRDFGSGFSYFAGLEIITDSGNNLLFKHIYSGRALIDLE